MYNTNVTLNGYDSMKVLPRVCKCNNTALPLLAYVLNLDVIHYFCFIQSYVFTILSKSKNVSCERNLSVGPSAAEAQADTTLALP
jgi:hypothetical protein